MEKRSLLIGAALEVIGEDGLSGFTQPRVARRAGLRQSHLTYYFPTRDDLLLAVADEAVRRRVEALGSALAVPSRSAKVAALVAVLTDPAQTRVLLALTQAADSSLAVRSSFAVLAAGLAPLSVDLLNAFGVEVTESSVGLLQAASTGIAVLALATGGVDFPRRAEDLLTDFLTRRGGTDRLSAPPNLTSDQHPSPTD